jgi:signal transduction histidine kinase
MFTAATSLVLSAFARCWEAGMRLNLPTTDTDVESLNGLRQRAGGFFVAAMWLSAALIAAAILYDGPDASLALAGSAAPAIVATIIYLKKPLSLSARMIITACLVNNAFLLNFILQKVSHASSFSISFLMIEAFAMIFFCWKTLWGIGLFVIIWHVATSLYWAHLVPGGAGSLALGLPVAIILAQCLGTSFIVVRVHRLFAENKEMACAIKKGAELGQRRKVLAEKAFQSKAEFLANISHELRTPLHVILNYARLSEKFMAKGDVEQTKYCLDVVNSSSKDLLGLFDALLTTSKLKTRKINFKKIKRDLVEAVDQALFNSFSILAQKNLQTIKIIKTKETLAICDMQKIVQVLTNLISNAARFSEANSLIEISVERFELDEASSLHVKVLDRGPGIPEAELDTIFEAFTQSSATKSGAGGAGLGLAICYEIVLAHGGMMWAENREGGGAIINFLIRSKLSELSSSNNLMAA